MRLRHSRLTDVLTVHAGDDHRAIEPGEVVDFDQPIGDTTLEQALGSHAAAFGDVSGDLSEASPASAGPPRRGRTISQESSS